MAVFFSIFHTLSFELHFYIDQSFPLNLFEGNFQSLKFRHGFTASNLGTFFSGMLKISQGWLLTTLVYRGFAYEGSNPDPKIWVHQTVFPEF